MMEKVIQRSAHWGKIVSRIMVIVGLTTLALATFVTVQPTLAACTISGVVFRDFNEDGLRDLREPGQDGVRITVYNAAGQIVGNAVSFYAPRTPQHGTYSINVPTDGQVRVEMTAIPDMLYSSRFGGYGGPMPTTVTFVDCTGPAVTLDFGITSAGEFCHTATPNLATSCFAIGDQINGPPIVRNNPAFISFPYTAAGDDPDTPLASAEQIGTTFGLGFHRPTGSYLVASFLKRHAGFGPGVTGQPSSGVIYRITPDGINPPQVSIFMDLPSIGINTGPITHPTTPASCPLPPGFTDCYLFDVDTWDAVGKGGLGDLEVSDDNRTVWLVNLFQRTLLEIPVGLEGVAPTAGQISSYSLTNLPGMGGCPLADRRPFGLGVNDGRIYVGSVCSGETGGAAVLRFYVHSMSELNPGAFRLELNESLNFDRGCADQGSTNCPSTPNYLPGDPNGAPTGPNISRTAAWQPWSNDWTPDRREFVELNYPIVKVRAEPWLTDIVFDNGDMLIGFRDRMGDRTGTQQPGPGYVPPFLELVNGIAAGDVLRACRNQAGQYTLEDNATCGGVTTGGAGSGQGPGGGEYYFHDRNNPIIPPAFPNDGIRRHEEISLGGLVDLPGDDRFAMTVFDPLPENAGFADPLFDSGVVWLNHDTGTRSQNYRILNGTGAAGPLNFGKANGLGDLEAFCGPPRLEIGNRVWEDLDRNGVQDPGEWVFAGVYLNLYLRQGANWLLIAQTQTNAQGEYYFNEQNIFFNNTVLANPQQPGITYFDGNGNGIPDAHEPLGVLPDNVYEVRLDDPRNYAPTGPVGSTGEPLARYFATRLRAAPYADGNDGARDSNAAVPAALTRVSMANVPVTRVVTTNFGANDHTYDFGFALQPPDTNVTPTPPPGGPTSDSDGATIAKTADTPFAQAGDEVIWTITVTNPTNAPLTNVEVEDTVPAELEILSASATRGTVTVNGQTVRILIDVLGPGETVTITIRTRILSSVTAPFIITNPAVIVGGASSSATVISVERLPETGESPLGRLLVTALIAACALGIAFFGLRLLRRIGN